MTYDSPLWASEGRVILEVASFKEEGLVTQEGWEGEKETLKICWSMQGIEPRSPGKMPECWPLHYPNMSSFAIIQGSCPFTEPPGPLGPPKPPGASRRLDLPDLPDDQISWTSLSSSTFLTTHSFWTSVQSNYLIFLVPHALKWINL